MAIQIGSHEAYSSIRTASGILQERQKQLLCLLVVMMPQVVACLLTLDIRHEHRVALDTCQMLCLIKVVQAAVVILACTIHICHVEQASSHAECIVQRAVRVVGFQPGG